MEALDLLHDARVGREPRVHVGARLRVALERLQHLEPARVAHRPDRVEREAVAVLVRVRVRFRVSVRVRVRVRVRVGVRVREAVPYGGRRRASVVAPAAPVARNAPPG